MLEGSKEEKYGELSDKDSLYKWKATRSSYSESDDGHTAEPIVSTTTTTISTQKDGLVS